MQQEKFFSILKGIFSTLVPLKRFSTPSGTGGTINSRDCYSVWFRHLICAYHNGLVPPIPGTVTELGPGANHLKPADLARPYRNLNKDDLTTKGIFIQCRK